MLKSGANQLSQRDSKGLFCSFYSIHFLNPLTLNRLDWQIEKNRIGDCQIRTQTLSVTRHRCQPRDQNSFQSDLLVEDSLEAAHLALDDVLGLFRQLRLDVLLETTEQEGPEDFVKTADDQNRFFLVQLDL